MNERTVLLLGLGMQGKPALHHLMQLEPALWITVVDASPEGERYVAALGSDRVRFVRLDIREQPEAIGELMQQSDVVVDLLPATLTFRAIELAVSAGTSVVSTSYLMYPDETDPQRRAAQADAVERLARSAQAQGITILPEFGLDPGIDLVLAAQAARELDEITDLYSYGAGLPEATVADNPIRYKFSWSVAGVLHSYFRPARIRVDGNEVTVAADDLFAPEHVHEVDLPEMGGRLECFLNGDALTYARILGLSDLRSTARYTCRWPGHAAFWRVAAGLGLLSRQPVTVGEAQISPVDFLTEFLGAQDQLQFGPGERDLVLVRVDARGLRGNCRTRIVYQLVADRDPETGFTGMGRTVGFPAGIGARMIMDREIGPGLLWPQDVPFERYIAELEALGLSIARSETRVAGSEVTV